MVINTGNANAGTGADGLARAEQTCVALAGLMGLKPEQVLPFSTGVIMETLPVDRITGLPAALAALRADAWGEAAAGIMTTDTLPKGRPRRIEIDGPPCHADRHLQGRRMIRPNMATMLGFIATDARIAPSLFADRGAQRR